MNNEDLFFLRLYQRTATLIADKSFAKSDRRRFRLTIRYPRLNGDEIGFSEDEEVSFLTLLRQFLTSRDASFNRACNLIELECDNHEHKNSIREARKIWKETLDTSTGIHIITKKMKLNESHALTIEDALDTYFNSHVFHADLSREVNWEVMSPESRAMLRMKIQLHSQQLIACIRSVDAILEDWLGTYK